MEGSDNIIVILGLCFLLIDWFSFAKGTGGAGGGGRGGAGEGGAGGGGWS